jgi:epoxyqueuosine reductase
VTSSTVKRLARESGFELAGIAAAGPTPDYARYRDWLNRGMAAEMGYLKDRRADLRSDPRLLLPSARSMVCVGKLYNREEPYSTNFSDAERAWISRYAWGDDYHDVLRNGLEDLAARLGEHEFRICVDTAPLLERSWARAAGLGWIGRNTCLIHEPLGSWFFLGELLTSLELEPDRPAPDRCGTCTRCIEACPTQALTADDNGAYRLDSSRCISYFTIELRGDIPEQFRTGNGAHVFGCDICQDVCPWNSRAPADADPRFAPREFAPPLEKLAALTESEFRAMFRGSPVTRPKYTGFLRNVAVAMGNSGLGKFRASLETLAAHPDSVVAGHARWALEKLA